jgi:hypothetical protein
MAATNKINPRAAVLASSLRRCAISLSLLTYLLTYAGQLLTFSGRSSFLIFATAADAGVVLGCGSPDY